MTEPIRVDEILMSTAAILFFFVLVRFAVAFRGSRGGRGAVAGGGVMFAIAPPTLALAIRPALDFPPGDYQALIYGSALWITLALALAAFAMSRLRAPDGVARRLT